MTTKPKTMIVTGAARGIGAGVTNASIERGYNVVANSLNITTSTFAAIDRLAVERRDIGDPSTAHEIVSTATRTFGSIDGVINNAGVYFAKPFTDCTVQDFERLSGINLRGYINITQIAVKQMLAQNRGESVICVSSAMVEQPIAGITASLPMVTKGGLEAITRKPRHGICEGWNKVQRRCTRGCQYAYARKRFQKVLTEPFSDGSDI